MIDRLLQQANADYFSGRSLRLDLLANCPQCLQTLAQWSYDDWHKYDATLTKEKLINTLSKCLNTDTIPITFVVLKSLSPIGAISLKWRPEKEFADFPADSVWGGTLHVVPEERNKGLGKELMKFAKAAAKHLGHNVIYFYTSNPNNVNMYVNMRAKILETRPFRNHTITLMSMG